MPCEEELAAYQQAQRALDEFEEKTFPVITDIPPIDDESAVPALEDHVKQQFEELQAAVRDTKAAYDGCRGGSATLS